MDNVDLSPFAIGRLPVSHPPFKGDQAMKPTFSCSQQCNVSNSIFGSGDGDGDGDGNCGDNDGNNDDGNCGNGCL